MTAILDRVSSVPLWKQVLDDLAKRIAVGEFVAAFPGELVLQRQYGVSRHTVRQALRQLREDGVVTAERGRTPRLAAPTEVEQPLGALYSLFTSVQAAGIVQRSQVRAFDVRTDGVVADRLGLDESTPLLYLERLRLAGDDPLALDCVWLPATIASCLLEADFANLGLYDELAARCGVRVTAGSEQLRAVIATNRERELLNIGSDVAVFAINRLGCAHGAPIEWRHTLIRGDRFSMTAQFSARSSYPLQVSAGSHTSAATERRVDDRGPERADRPGRTLGR